MTRLPDDMLDAARQLMVALSERGLTVVTAESCTGGLIASTLTALPGSSTVVDGGFVTYSNQAKSRFLGIDPALIAQHGAVSGAVALAMALGALSQSDADLSIAVTGIAGPGGGSPQKPVGTVHMAACLRGHAPSHRLHVFQGDRDQIRQATVVEALRLALGHTLCYLTDQDKTGYGPGSQ